MTITLRPRQELFVSNAIDALIKHGNTLGIAPTGSGKTIMFSSILGRLEFRRALVIAHRDQLVFQNKKDFESVNTDIETSIFNSNTKNWDGKVVFAMIQTLSRHKNLKSMPSDIDIIVIDEAHHICAKSYLKVLALARNLNQSVMFLGVTATPRRSDNKNLKKCFSNIADRITISELIQSGHLVKPHILAPKCEDHDGFIDDLDQSRTGSGSYDMEKSHNTYRIYIPNDDVVDFWKDEAGDRQTVVFCCTVNHAKEVTVAFRRANVRADIIYHEMPDSERKDILDSLHSGKLQVIINVAILTEGWDYPPVSCAIILRPFSHKSVMLQMIGRALRIVDTNKYPGVVKNDCIVIDFGFSTQVHGKLEDEFCLQDEENG